MRFMPEQRDSSAHPNFRLACLFFFLAFPAPLTHAILTGFPRPRLESRQWLIGLIIANLVLLLLTPFAFRNAQWLRPLAYFYAAVHLLNGTGHTVATVFGRTVASVHFPRPAPGFYSSPLLLAGSIFLFLRLRPTGRKSPINSCQSAGGKRKSNKEKVGV